ncbi:uncharacterized protein METZ01_LOCUS304742, partial [marine metagenome]
SKKLLFDGLTVRYRHSKIFLPDRCLQLLKVNF